MPQQKGVETNLRGLEIPDGSFTGPAQMSALWTSCMDGLDKRGGACEGVQRGGLRPLEARRNLGGLDVQRRELAPRERSFQGAPDPLHRVQRGAVRGHEDQADVGGEPRPLGRLRATMVQHEASEAVRKGRRDGSDEELEAWDVQRGPCETEPVACRRLARASDVEPFEDMVERARRAAPRAP